MQAPKTKWIKACVDGETPGFRYGHTLTAIEGKAIEDNYIVAFGGMIYGGYMGEVNEVFVLRMKDKSKRVARIPASKKRKGRHRFHDYEDDDEPEAENAAADIGPETKAPDDGPEEVQFYFEWETPTIEVTLVSTLLSTYVCKGPGASSTRVSFGCALAR